MLGDEDSSLYFKRGSKITTQITRTSDNWEIRQGYEAGKGSAGGEGKRLKVICNGRLREYFRRRKVRKLGMRSMT